MSSFRQLLRNPLRTFSLLLLLSAAITFFCLGMGVFASSSAGVRKVDEGFVTLAVPQQIKTEHTELEHGVSWTAEEGIPGEMISVLEELEKDGSVRGVYRQHYINAYSPQLTALTRIPSGEAASPESAQGGGVFIIEIESVGDFSQNFYGEAGGRISVQARIIETLAMHPDMSALSRAKVSIDCPYEGGEETLKSLNLRPGARYIINAEAVTDGDLWVRRNISSILGIRPDEVDYNKIDRDVPEEIINNMKKENVSPEALPVAIYRHKGEEGGLFLTQHDLDLLNSFEIFVIDYHGAYKKQTMIFPIPNENGELVTDPETGLPVGRSLADLVLPVFAEEVQENTEEFLASHAEWAEAVRQMQTRLGTVGLIGTDMLEGIYGFQSKEAVITEGRSFEAKEYREGAPVCILSDSLAKKSGLSVGDTVELSPYWEMHKDISPVDLALTGLDTQRYSGAVGFEAEARSYTIIGLYHLDDMWKQGQYSFNANMIFIPNAAMPAEPFSCNSGLFLSVVLRNGSAEAFGRALAERGFPADSFTIYDGGYSEIAESLGNLKKNAGWLLLAGAGVLAAALAVFLILFVSRQKYSLGLMRSLGASDQASLRSTLGLCLIPAAAASVIGAVLGALLLGQVQRRLLGDTASPETFAPPLPLFAAASGIIAFIIFFILTCVFLHWAGKASPASLLKRGE